MPADVFLCAGEASGDLQASMLVTALRKIRPELRVAAVGGERLRAAGADVVLDSVAGGWASIGHLRAYLKIPWLLCVMLALALRLIIDPPRLLVCVDFGAFNLRMLEWLRFCGYRGRALYYFPPGAWFDNPDQARKVARVSTPLTPFAHQADFYARLGLPIEYFGHPLAGKVEIREPRVVSTPPTIAVLPGSRHEEVALHLPALAEAARRMARDRAARFIVVAASDSLAGGIRGGWPEECGGAGAVVRADAPSAVSDADVAWVASGTAVLETALRGIPLVSFYRVSAAQYQMVLERAPQLAVGPVTLPNLVTGERIVPELLQDELTPERLLHLTVDLLDDASRREAMASGYARLRAALGSADALERIAAYASSLIPPHGAAP
jgi:lipid-A-disaccharide synthase